MDIILSLLVLAGLFWLHRRAVAAAYQAGWNDGEAIGQQGHERHGLRPLPMEGATWQTDN
jgi:hypothetical protein